jgi:RNA polymerase sigma-70 factor, ECF subfamily
VEDVLRRKLTLMPGRTRSGDEHVALAYEPRHVAPRPKRQEDPDHALPRTEVVHKAPIRLMDGSAFDRAADRCSPFAKATRSLRDALIDHARRRDAAQRGGGRRRVPLDLAVDYFEEQGLDVAVHESLDRLAGLHERRCRVVTLRYFGGLTTSEIATALHISVENVVRDWRIARALQSNELNGEGTG